MMSLSPLSFWITMIASRDGRASLASFLYHRVHVDTLSL